MVRRRLVLYGNQLYKPEQLAYHKQHDEVCTRRGRRCGLCCALARLQRIYLAGRERAHVPETRTTDACVRQESRRICALAGDGADPGARGHKVAHEHLWFPVFQMQRRRVLRGNRLGQGALGVQEGNADVQQGAVHVRVLHGSRSAVLCQELPGAHQATGGRDPRDAETAKRVD